MALLSFRGFDTPSLPAQGEQRRSTYFNIGRDIPERSCRLLLDVATFHGRMLARDLRNGQGHFSRRQLSR
jgi:hypothetical protein